jgi:hypothetical protein
MWQYISEIQDFVENKNLYFLSKFYLIFAAKVGWFGIPPSERFLLDIAETGGRPMMCRACSSVVPMWSLALSVSAKFISAVKKKNPGAAARRPIPLLGRDRDLVSRANMPDPDEPGAFRDVQVNRRVDVLAQELASERIEFEVGRIIQAVFERDSGARLGSGGWNAGGSRDQTVAHELATIYAIDDAEQVRKFTA